ncbi:hypothetical protein P175DRAFT_0560689 [Aspergillus ochraceoroseus IBT 24754]|uniref:Uncharacterized protein n=1 Tax=Aspergillus ochraceoroseus IBT 24754 TaxID=1392256 RepID=A0A2T5LME8_9EURO|nr:uncharacterized protein P175DRAFT_0560689 [Aspergillus ochraceoroseus IBT 24754]PTU17462.1 hypothetical protein P175DRAFT_0560689 [Aspergillus ochraceoroseus IBT 24754]
MSSFYPDLRLGLGLVMTVMTMTVEILVMTVMTVSRLSDRLPETDPLLFWERDLNEDISMPTRVRSDDASRSTTGKFNHDGNQKMASEH